VPDYLCQFLAYLEQKGHLQVKKVDASHIREYFEYMLTRKNKRTGGQLSPITIGHHMYSVRLFFEYLLDTDIIDSSPIGGSRFILGKSIPRNIATVDEIKLIQAACTSKREKAIVALAYGGGLRRTEIQDLNTQSIFLSKSKLIVEFGKFGKRREVPLAQSVVADLKDYFLNERDQYISKYQNKEEPAFILNNFGGRMKGEHLNDHLKEVIIRTKNPDLIEKGLTLHCLRASIATHLLEAGATEEFVGGFLGHSEIDTLVHYIKQRKRLKFTKLFR
jgi:integrase/recombinase XerD